MNALAPFRRLLPYAAILAGLAGAFAATQRLNAIKAERHLTDTDIVRNAPPVVAFTTVALGCFRGLVADLLWLRTASLQEQGKYFELVQLANWICMLQPRFTGATVYLAWNMSYNISVTCTDHADRWRWVNNGLKLLLESIQYNPGDPLLYREIAWIYTHKIGDIYDSANLYYRNKLAEEMTKVFGGPEPDWAALENAPATAAALEAAVPKDSPVWSAMRAAGIDSLSALSKAFRADGALPAAMRAAAPPSSAAAMATLDAHLRARWLRESYAIDPAKAAALDKAFGRFDWRLADTYAAHWAYLGLNISKVKKDENCQRVLDHSIRNSFLDGRLLVFDSNNFHSFCTVPNLDMADAAMEVFRQSWLKTRENSYESAYRYFMKDAIMTLHNFGDYEKASRFYDVLRADFPWNTEYSAPIEDFVLGRLKENATSGTNKQVSGMVNGFLRRSFFLLAFGDRKAADAHEAIARQIYEIYKAAQKESWDRVGLPPFDEMRREELQRALKNLPGPMAEALRIEIGLAEGWGGAAPEAPTAPAE